MIRNVVDINWKYLGDAVPAFLTLIIIPCETVFAVTSFAN